MSVLVIMAPTANYLDAFVAVVLAVRLAVIICDIVHRADGKRLMSQSLALFVKLQELPADVRREIEKKNVRKYYSLGIFHFII